MNTPIVTTQANVSENCFAQSCNTTNTRESENSDMSTIIGWAIDKNRLKIILDYQNIKPESIFSAGGNNSLEEDEEILRSIKENPTIIIKSWEPPTDDFLDFLDELSKKVNKIDIFPIGTSQNSYKPEKKDIEIWNSKLKNFQNIWMRK